MAWGEGEGAGSESKTYKPQAENKVTVMGSQAREREEDIGKEKRERRVLKRISKLTAIRKESQFERLNSKSGAQSEPFYPKSPVASRQNVD